MPTNSGYSLDAYLLGKALSHYLGLKEDPKFTSCYRCGYYPATIILDAIRNIAFDLDSKDINYDNVEGYEDFDELNKDASIKAFINGFIDSDVKAANLKPYGVKAYFSLPLYINQENRA